MVRRSCILARFPSRATLMAVLLAWSGAAVPAHAADPGDCAGVGDHTTFPNLMAARVRPPGRTFFVKNASDGKTCPDQTSRCRTKAFLVAGDAVLAGATHGGFTCVDFVGSKGADRQGWMPSASLDRLASGPIAPEDWTGTWIAEEAEISIKPGSNGRLAVHGDATWGARDPDRVKRGAVNIGEFEAAVRPTGADLAFDVGTDATLPVDKGDDSDCKVWMHRVGAFLAVDDNNNCGGANVTFRGAFRRKP